ncbi:predicted protein [Naegleria gruberi]|uniref:Predicted protein n=1 Tax=Naegleria gruberi TaxID=5762 RepID=D2UY58_NAEGR|nr:uncharacterized protein NAEGRDRAFT_61354 [Naegleria gruberi]EFC50419.1 predicted protein [Naegleria gruberi]|eukprot:XP_002683163.1 predicted protein [Naegleria gruberi strain NEG-M]
MQKGNNQQNKKRVASSSTNTNNNNSTTVERPTKKIKESQQGTIAPSDGKNDIISKELQKSLPFDPHFVDSNNEKKEKTQSTTHVKPIKALPQKSRKKQKSEERKKKKVEEKKAKDTMRQQLIESHQKNTLKDEELKLLKPIGSIGIGSETTKQELQRKAIYEQLGIKETAPKAEKFWNKRNPELINEKWNEQGLQLYEENDEDLIKINSIIQTNSKDSSSDKMQVDEDNKPEEKKPLMVLDFFGTGNTVSNVPSAKNISKKENEEKKEQITESIFYDSDEDPMVGLNLEDMGKSHNQLIDDMIEKLDQSKTDEEKEIKFTRFYVTVKRKPEIQDQRMLLPICGEEQRIMETINETAGLTTPEGQTITPLKLIIMSATLQLENFTDNKKLFANPPPVVDVQSRQYPVVVHFNKRTIFNDYMEAAFKKVVKIHESLPNGGILIFLTGRKEIEFLVEKLKNYSTKRYVQIVKKEMERKKSLKEKEEENQRTVEEEEELINQLGDLSDSDDDGDEISSSKKAVGLKEDENLFDDDQDQSEQEEKEEKEIKEEEEKGKSETVVLFQENIKSDKVKKEGEENNAKLNTPIENIILQMKSMGIKQVEKFPFPTPPDADSVKKGVDALVNLGALDKFISKEGNIETMITKMGSAMNRFPLHPRFAKMLILSNNNPDLLLYTAGAVSVMTVQQIFMHDNHLTLLKEKIERRKQEELKEKFSRLGMKSDAIDKNKKLQIDLEEIEEEQAAESLEENLSEEQINEEKQYLDEQELEMKTKCKEIKKMWSHPLSDHLAMLKAVGAYLYADDAKEFCLEYMLHQKNMREVRKLHRQLLNTVRSELKASALEIDTDETEVDIHEKDETVEFPEPKDDEDEQYQVDTAIRQVICAGMVDQVARLATVEDLAHMDVSYKETSKPYVTLSLGRSVPVFIHPGSCLFGRHPEYVVFTELSKSRKNKTYMRGVTAIEPNWISRFGNSKCGFVKFSDPLESPAPFYDSVDDMVKCFVRPTIRQSATGVVWTLPIEPVEFKDGSRQVNVFAKSILEGKVFEGLKLSKETMVNLPTIIQSKRFLDLTISLKKVFPNGLKCSKAKLQAKWNEDSSFLRKELSNLGLKF